MNTETNRSFLEAWSREGELLITDAVSSFRKERYQGNTITTCLLPLPNHHTADMYHHYSIESLSDMVKCAGNKTTGGISGASCLMRNFYEAETLQITSILRM
jgi:hypothetical protein